MSWYEEAKNAIVALINAAIEERGDMPEPKEITGIIAKHDPNRWIPVTEGDPRSGAVIQVCMQRGAIRRVLEATYDGEQRYWFNDPCGLELHGVTHWRPIVLPEVKG